MDLEKAIANLPNLPRQQRQQHLVAIIAEGLDCGGRDQALLLLNNVWRLGVKWLSLIRRLAEDSEVPEPIRQACREFLQQAETAEIRITTPVGFKQAEIDSFLSQLDAIRDARRLVLRIETENLYVNALTAIAAWASERHAEIALADESQERPKQYIRRSGMLDAVADPSSDPVRFDSENILGFTRIAHDQPFDTDFHAGRLLDLFRRHVPASSAAAYSALTIAFAELIENAVKHGRIHSPAWLFATYHPKPRVMHVAICDRGIGIQQSFLESDNPEIRAIGNDPQRWVRHCTEPLVTSKSREHAGYGLFLVRELCRRNGGSLALLSGSACFRLFPLPDGTIKEVTEPLPGRWRGTFLGLNLHTDRPLDLGPVYDSIPPVSGDADGFDLFQEG